MEKFSCRDFRRHVNRKPRKTTQENSAREKSEPKPLTPN
jgi:hypothetical protein